MILIDAVLVLAVILLVFLVWSAIAHAWLGVPYVPTPWPVVREAVRLLDLRSGDVLADLGAGDARVLTAAVRQTPGLTARGWELVWPVWCIGRLRTLFARAAIDLRCGDARSADLRGVTAVFLYLTPALLAELLPKLRSDLQPGTRVVCLTFSLPGLTPTEQRVIPTWRGPQTLSLYRF